MKNIMLGIVCVLVLMGCISKTHLGKCIGLNQEEDKNLNYEYNAINIGI